MERAIELSLDNVKQSKGGPFGAVIVKDNKIIAEGVNLVTATNDPTAHAEIIAIRKACALMQTFKLTGCTIYSSCEPCPMCLGALYWAHPDAIFYGTTKQEAAAIGFDDSFIYEQITLPPSARTIPMTQLLPGKAHVAFDEWEKNTKKIRY